MRAIIVGGDSTIGHALAAALRARGDTIWTTTRRPNPSDGMIRLDLSDRNLLGQPLPKADLVCFCAAITRFADCRQNPDLARTVNVTAPVALAGQLVRQGTRALLLSTSAVFDWQTPNVPASKTPCPTSLYGKLKAEAEAGFRSFGSQASIVRFAKILHSDLALFTSWIKALEERRPIEAFTDLSMAPISLDDAVRSLTAVIDDKAGGIYQLSGACDISYFDAAVHLADRSGSDRALVQPASAAEAGIPSEEITVFSSLDSSRLAQLSCPAPNPFAVLDAVFGSQIRRSAELSPFK